MVSGGILRRLESYDGLNQDLLKSEINKRITSSQKYLSSSAAAGTTTKG
jgi:hypothetical protein